MDEEEEQQGEEEEVAETGIDSLTLRRQNLIPPDAFPFTTATRTTPRAGERTSSIAPPDHTVPPSPRRIRR